MGADVTLTPVDTIGTSRIAVAAAPTCFGGVNVTVGAVTYPDPAELIVTIPTPPVVDIPTVAAAPAPVFEKNCTPGADVYPEPVFTN